MGLFPSVDGANDKEMKAKREKEVNDRAMRYNKKGKAIDDS